MRSRRLTPGRGRRNRGRVWPGPLTRLKRLGRLIELPLAVPGCGLFEIAERWTTPRRRENVTDRVAPVQESV